MEILAFLFALAWAQDQQVGARTKAMGGSYTAFEDDPVSVWLNPAGIAAQPDGGTIAYQTYTIYETTTTSTLGALENSAETSWTNPALVPSYLGAVFQLGSPESPQAVGFCFATPFHLKFAYDPLGTPVAPTLTIDQSFYRIRGAYGRTFRFRKTGEEGFLPSLSVGIGLDVNVMSWSGIERNTFSTPSGSPEAASDIIEGTDMGFGGGLGILLGLYDNTRNFKVNFGAAYQSKANFDFSVESGRMPLFDWPNQYQVGLTFFLLEGFPLRITLDGQLIEWERAIDSSDLSGVDSFRNAINLSWGVEYRWTLSETMRLYTRGGLRHFQAPWGDAKNLPAAAKQRLAIAPDDDRFLIYSLGIGIGWMNEAGKQRIFDVGVDFGGDAPGVALGFTMEF